MATTTHQDAQRLIDAASKADWTFLPEYKGSKTDLNYLRNYVIKNVADVYDVSASLLKTPTVFSTTLIRDFVHRAIYGNSTSEKYADLKNQPGFDADFRNDVAGALRYPASDSCGLMGYQLFRVFESLGFETVRVGAVEGDLVGGVKGQWGIYSTGKNFADAHVTTQVFVKDLNKFIIQDSTFNLMFTDRSGTPLSLNELRDQQFARSPAYKIAHDDSYLHFRENGYSMFEGAFDHSSSTYIRNVLLKPWSMLTYSWDTNDQWYATVVLMRADSYSSAIAYSSYQAAVMALEVAQATGDGWEDGAVTIRGSRFVAGFKLYDRDTGQAESEWLTVARDGGEYISRDRISGRVLKGSYDQLVAEASGKGIRRNPGEDLSDFLNPASLLGRNGTVYSELEATPYDDGLAILTGTAASNLITSSAGIAQTMTGLAGNDLYIVNDAFDRVAEYSRGGFDKILTSVSYTMSPDTQVEVLSAASRSSTQDINLVANRFTQQMIGNNGDNVMFGSSSGQKMFGYAGNDVYYVNSRSDVVYETSGRDRVFTSTSYVLSNASAVEDLAVTDPYSYNRISLVGNHLANMLTGNKGANTLEGRGGNDRLYGLAGNDTYIVDSGGDRIYEKAGEGTDTAFTKVSFRMTSGADVEVLRVHGSVSASTGISLIGNGLQDMLVGHNGDNAFNPGGTNGTTMAGKGGDDDYYVLAAADAVWETAGNGFDRVFTNVDFILTIGQEIEELHTNTAAGATGLALTGNAYDQRIVGDTGTNTINGGGGDDTMTGGDGADQFVFDSAVDGDNLMTINDFVAGTDAIHLDGAMFGGLAAGALDAAAFVVASDATDAAHRIVYDDTTGALFYDSDGDGAAAKVRFGTLVGTPVLADTDFLIL